MDDFSSLSTIYFAAINSYVPRNLLDMLRRRRANVSKGRNTEFVSSLYNVVNDDLPSPEDDPDRPMSGSKIMKSGSTKEDDSQLSSSKSRGENVNTRIDTICKPRQENK